MTIHATLPAPHARIGRKVLVTCDNWFVAPDGRMYRAVFGTLTAIINASEHLGIKVNARSADWYMTIGRMTLAGCQIHYIVETDDCTREETVPDFQTSAEKGCVTFMRPTAIFFADEPVAVEVRADAGFEPLSFDEWLSTHQREWNKAGNETGWVGVSRLAWEAAIATRSAWDDFLRTTAPAADAETAAVLRCELDASKTIRQDLRAENDRLRAAVGSPALTNAQVEDLVERKGREIYNANWLAYYRRGIEDARAAIRQAQEAA